MISRVVGLWPYYSQVNFLGSLNTNLFELSQTERSPVPKNLLGYVLLGWLQNLIQNGLSGRPYFDRKIGLSRAGFRGNPKTRLLLMQPRINDVNNSFFSALCFLNKKVLNNIISHIESKVSIIQ